MSASNKGGNFTCAFNRRNEDGNWRLVLERRVEQIQEIEKET